MSRDRSRPPILSGPSRPAAPADHKATRSGQVSASKPRGGGASVSPPRGGESYVSPPRGGPARTISALIPAIGGTAFRRFGFVQSSVISRWGEIVGERYAGLSAPESIRFPRAADGGGGRARGVLTILAHGAHAPMLQHAAPTIIERVNRFFGYAAVARLTIRQGAPPLSRPARRPLMRPMTADERRARIDGLGPMLGDSLRTIEDAELRTMLEAMACGLAQAPDQEAAAAAAVTSLPIRGRVR